METKSSSGNIERRSLLRLAGGVGLAVAFGPALASCSSAGTKSAGASTGSVTPFTGKLEFTAWDFQPDTVKSLVGAWSAESKVPVNVQVIPNLGYSAAIQTRLRGGSSIDVFYDFAYNSQKFVKAGWASKLNGLPGADAMLQDMFPSARSRYVAPDGSMVSVPYFSAVHMLFHNTKYLTKAGFSAPPQSLSETYNQSKKLKTSGICDTPYVAYWVKEFCEEYLNVYLLAEGVTPFDAQGNPIFADDKKTVDVFNWWQTMYQEGLTPKSVLTDDPGKLSAYMAQGSAAFMVLHHYFLTSIRTAKGAQAANVQSISAGGSSGKTLQIGEVLQMGNIKSQSQRNAAWELMKYYGWKDKQGKFSVFAKWAKAAGLAAPYAGFFTDPEVIAAFPPYYDLPKLSQTFEGGSDVVSARTLPWYPDFQTKVGDLVQAMLIGQATPEKTVVALANAAKKAKVGGGL